MMKVDFEQIRSVSCETLFRHGILHSCVWSAELTQSALTVLCSSLAQQHIESPIHGFGWCQRACTQRHLSQRTCVHSGLCNGIFSPSLLPPLSVIRWKWDCRQQSHNLKINSVFPRFPFLFLSTALFTSSIIYAWLSSFYYSSVIVTSWWSGNNLNIYSWIQLDPQTTTLHNLTNPFCHVFF